MKPLVVRSADAPWRTLKVAHPAGEEVFVLEGEVTIGPDHLKAGDYLYTPPDGKHAAASVGGCVFLVTLPRPVEILDD